jgi:uncharacterized protein
MNKTEPTGANSEGGFVEPKRAWWRNAWCWLVLAGPTVVVFAGLTTFWIASSGADTLVDHDEYQKGGALSKGVRENSGSLTPARQARNHAATGGTPERNGISGK